MDESGMVNFVENRRPFWEDLSSYPPNPDGWSYRQWAWEFLRRNPEYQDACRRSKGPPARGIAARRFGRPDLKSYKAEFVKEDEERRWLPESIRRVPIKRSREEADVTLRLAQGKVAVIFDLTQTKEAGLPCIKSMLVHAKELLTEEVIILEKSCPNEYSSKSPKIRRNKLLCWLRLYDAKAHFGATELDIMRVLYREGSPTPLQKIELRKQINADWDRAQSMVEGEYLSLLPLSDLQERSSKKQNISAISNGPLTGADKGFSKAVEDGIDQ